MWARVRRVPMEAAGGVGVVDAVVGAVSAESCARMLRQRVEQRTARTTALILRALRTSLGMSLCRKRLRGRSLLRVKALSVRLVSLSAGMRLRPGVTVHRVTADVIAGAGMVAGIAEDVAEIVIAAGIAEVAAANGRRRLRGRMRDVWMLCVSGLLRVGQGFRPARMRL
jgi:hypothetical protein